MAAYRKCVGAGAIGHGIAFELQGNETLGRNESRLGHLLPTRDFCKLHIICHYIGVFLGKHYPVHLISAVGDEEAGEKLIREAREANLQTDWVIRTPDFPTPFCVCFQYPDKSGGNITEGSSSALCVRPDWIDKALAGIGIGPDSIVLAAPEIPFESQLHLLAEGRRQGAFTVSTSISDQALAFLEEGGLANTDLFAINIDEARAIAQLPADADPETVIERCAKKCFAANPELRLIITLGSEGVIAAYVGKSLRLPGIKVTAVATAGAGDALLAGTITGLWSGLPFMPDTTPDPGTPLTSAVEFGIALAAFSVTSADTIHFGINPHSFIDFLKSRNQPLSPEMRNILS